MHPFRARPPRPPPALAARLAAAAARGRGADAAQDEHLAGAELVVRRRHRHLRARSRAAHAAAATRCRTSTRPRSAPSASRSRACSSARSTSRSPPPARCRTSCPRWRSSTSRSCSATTRTRARCSTARSAQDLLQKFPPKGLVALAWAENGFRHMTNSKRAGQRARGPQGPEDAHHGEPDPHPGVPAVRHPAHADGLHRGVHRAAAGHGRRPGEPAVGDHVGQARPGAEVPDAHRPRLFAGGHPDEQGEVGRAVGRRQAGVRATPRARRSRPTARASTTTSARRVAELRAQGHDGRPRTSTRRSSRRSSRRSTPSSRKRFGQENIDRIRNYR